MARAGWVGPPPLPLPEVRQQPESLGQELNCRGRQLNLGIFTGLPVPIGKTKKKNGKEGIEGNLI